MGDGFTGLIPYHKIIFSQSCEYTQNLTCKDCCTCTGFDVWFYTLLCYKGLHIGMTMNMHNEMWSTALASPGDPNQCGIRRYHPELQLGKSVGQPSTSNELETWLVINLDPMLQASGYADEQSCCPESEKEMILIWNLIMLWHNTMINWNEITFLRYNSTLYVKFWHVHHLSFPAYCTKSWDSGLIEQCLGFTNKHWII